MFGKIVVPVDLTPKNERAVEVARDLASRFDGRVILLHVIETLDLPFEELREFYDRLQARAIAHMEGLSATLSAEGISFEIHVLYGDRTSKVLEFAQEHGAELLIMDSHVIRPGAPGRGPTTISYRVAVAAHCPVLLVKGGEAATEDS